jgi:hypothetical protein
MGHYSITSGMIINFGQSKHGLGIVLLQNGNVYDFTNGSFNVRQELTIA